MRKFLHHAMELHHQGILERECPLPCRRFKAAPPVAKGYGCSEECEAAGPLSVLKRDLALVSFLTLLNNPMLDLQEASAALLGPGADAAPAITTPEQLPSTQALLPFLETFKGPGKAGDQGQRVEVAKGKEAKVLPEAKGPEAD
nr:hypothetical protein CFP56_14689 [Quercus suber]